MGVLFSLRIVIVAKTDAFCKLGYGRFFAGKKVPTACAAWTAVALSIGTLFSGGQRGCFIWINAEDNNFEIFSHGRLQVLRTCQQRVEYQCAKIGTFIVSRNEDDGMSSKKTIKRSRL